jgi:hypothetical protein
MPFKAYEVGGMYFVVDGHHRVALAHRLEMEYIDAEITAIRTSHALMPDVDVRQLIQTEQHRIFKERSRLLVRHPEAKIEFSRTGYGQLLDLVQAHAYEMSVRAGELVPLEDATADWYEREYLAALAALPDAEPPEADRYQTKGDTFLWGTGQAPRAADNEPERHLVGCARSGAHRSSPSRSGA